ncbi:prepilin-type N-terminal cleavage/methylation domain-containing protein [Candidatus Nomurabacteria bacterium]|nr:prepilin-type N-terminal cleavage/methylation domain-containing protein [Candidatus Nomurabacteria bacterium]
MSNNLFKIKLKVNEKGFTIIETMIAISLFLIIVIIGMGALLNANLLHNKSQNYRDIMDNLSFIMEDMSRNIRTGYDYHCIDQNLNEGYAVKDGSNCWGVSFKSSVDNSEWVYYINNNGEILKAVVLAPYTDPLIFSKLSLDNIKLKTGSGFLVVGSNPTDNQQPLILIKLIGEITYKGRTLVTPFSLQTSVSQRLLDTP